MDSPRKFFNWSIFIAFFLVMILIESNPSAAFTPGKTYDSTNYQEIEALLIPPVLNWVKKGEIILNTAEDFKFKWAPPENFIQESAKNAGRYTMSKDGMVIDTKTGTPAEYISGYPFPEAIDLKDPEAGMKVMERRNHRRYFTADDASCADSIWVGNGGMERSVVASIKALNYQNRYRGAISNPNNFLFQNMIFISQPFDLRGISVMTWNYNDSREDASFSYVPMIRRVTRQSAAARSDPFLGSDACTDDSFGGWAGKNANMTWKMIEDKKILAPFASIEKVQEQRDPDQSISRKIHDIQGGWEVPGWKGSTYAPATALWVRRDAWVVEAIPKDPYYNFGRMVYYIDQEADAIAFKVMYDRAGEYWKTLVNASSYHVCEEWTGPMQDLYVQIDDKSRHGTYSGLREPPDGGLDRFNLPAGVLGPDTFTTSNLLQMSK
jgi:hypothetical protein